MWIEVTDRGAFGNMVVTTAEYACEGGFPRLARREVNGEGSDEAHGMEAWLACERNDGDGRDCVRGVAVEGQPEGMREGEDAVEGGGRGVAMMVEGGAGELIEEQVSVGGVCLSQELSDQGGRGFLGARGQDRSKDPRVSATRGWRRGEVLVEVVAEDCGAVDASGEAGDEHLHHEAGRCPRRSSDAVCYELYAPVKGRTDWGGVDRGVAEVVAEVVRKGDPRHGGLVQGVGVDRNAA